MGDYKRLTSFTTTYNSETVVLEKGKCVSNPDLSMVFLNAPLSNKYTVDFTLYMGNLSGSFTIKYPNGVPYVSFYMSKEGISGKYVQKYRSGKTAALYHYVSGVLCGDFKLYHRNGNVRTSGRYISNRYDGVIESFTRQGRPLWTQVYSKGTRQGTWVRYYIESDLYNCYTAVRSLTSYSNGKKNGGYTEFFKNGCPKETRNYKDGNICGLMLQWKKPEAEYTMSEYTPPSRDYDKYPLVIPNRIKKSLKKESDSSCKDTLSVTTSMGESLMLNTV